VARERDRVSSEAVRAGGPQVGEAPSRGRRVRRRIVRVLRRVPSRTILTICFGMALAAILLATFPFSTSGDDGTTLDCGPPLYEVLVPSDPAFEVPEDLGCAQPARQRVVFAGLLFGAAFVGAALTQILERGETRYHHSRWLRGPRPSRKARKRREAARVEAEQRALDAIAAQGSTPARSSERNVSLASSVIGPGARSTR
jgi:hypothetical protein